MLDALKNVLVTVTSVALDVLGVSTMLWHRVVVGSRGAHTQLNDDGSNYDARTSLPAHKIMERRVRGGIS